MELHVGIDDTDSLKSGCTTYLIACLIEILWKNGYKNFLDYPNIVRLNPNIPWKTRGNGAVCLRLEVPEESYEEIKELTVSFLEENFEEEVEETNPGIVFLKGIVPEPVKTFSLKALSNLVSLTETIKLVKKFGGEAFGFNKGRGIVGALAAIGETLDGDHTYEIITYRTTENRGKPRKISPESVQRMDLETKPYTFNNIDPETGRILVTPRGPDPVLFGIRGETPEIVKKAAGMVEVYEPIERWVIFRTNHGTDAHLKNICRVKDVQPYTVVVVEGFVSRNPETIPGSHVIFGLNDGTGEIWCAAYEPTGKFRETVKNLIVGDRVRVYGGLRKAKPVKPLTINLEKIEILELTRKTVLQNPACPNCGKKMSSMGTGKGFRCKKCGYKNPKAEKVLVEIPRNNLKPGLYLPPPRAHRHLTKPIQRYGMEKPERKNFYKQIHPKNFWGLGNPPKT